MTKVKLKQSDPLVDILRGGIPVKNANGSMDRAKAKLRSDCCIPAPCSLEEKVGKITKQPKGEKP
jgi:hypothetical protein